MAKRPSLAAAGLAAVLFACGALLLLLYRTPEDRAEPEPPDATAQDATAPAPEADNVAAMPKEPIPSPALKATPPPVRPANGCTVGARVLNGDGSPAAGVAVHMKADAVQQGEATPFAERTVYTDEAGRFLLSGVPGRIALRLEIDEPRSALRALGFELRDAKGDETVDLGDLMLLLRQSLRLRIVGPDERPVERATVFAVANEYPGSKELDRRGIRESRRRVTEMGQGEYALDRLPAGKIRLHVVAEGFAYSPNRPVSVELPRDEPLLIPLEVGGRLAGTVRDTKGNPIPNAKIEAHGSLQAQFYEGIETDAEGRFDAAYILPDKYEVHVGAKGFASERKQDVPSGTADLEFILPREAVFFGKVVAEEDGRAIERARVFLNYETENSLGISGHNTETDASGRFSFHRIPPGHFKVSARHDDFLPTDETIMLELSEGQRVEDQVIRLGRGLHATGRLVDSATAEPIAGARVKFHYQNPERRKNEWHLVDEKSANTAPDGAFIVAGLAEGQHEVSCEAKGYFRKKGEHVSVDGRSIEGMELTLDRGGTISGQVLDGEGKPVAGARVSARSPSREDNRDPFTGYAKTGADGRFTVVGFPEAPDYAVEAHHDVYATATVGGVSVKARQDVTGVEIRISAGGSISGRVRDTAGNGIAGTTVYVKEEAIPPGRRGYIGASQTDPVGAYEILRLPPGTYQVSAGAPGFKRAEKGGVQVKESQPTTGVDITLAVLGDAHALSGRVIDAEGRPIEGATARLRGHGIREYTIDSQTTGSNGRFTVTWSDEMYRALTASKAGYETAYFRESFKIDERLEALGEVTLVLERSATITGQVRAPGQNSFNKLHVLAVVPGQTGSRAFRRLFERDGRSKVDPAGRFELTVGPGTHTIQADAQGFAPALSSPITVGPGERREGIILDLVAEGRIEGRVLRNVSTTLRHLVHEFTVATLPSSLWTAS